MICNLCPVHDETHNVINNQLSISLSFFFFFFPFPFPLSPSATAFDFASDSLGLVLSLFSSLHYRGKEMYVHVRNSIIIM